MLIMVNVLLFQTLVRFAVLIWLQHFFFKINVKRIILWVAKTYSELNLGIAR